VRDRLRWPGRTALVAALLVLVAGCGGTESPIANVRTNDHDGMHGVVLPSAYHLPDVRMTDTAGRPYRLRSDTSKPLTMVFFGYTNCPDICRIVMANLASAVTRLAPADRAKVGMLFVTSDPARDTPQVIRAYLDRYNPGFEGVTGKLPAIKQSARALGVPIAKGHRLPGGGYDVDHGTQVVGARADGTAPIVWTQGTPPGAIAADITKILHSGMPGSKSHRSGT
jgi:protein SCO1/2